MEEMIFEQDVWYIARTNEEGPPIKCQFLRWNEHVNSGKFNPIFAEKTENGWREFLFMGPVVAFDLNVWNKLMSLSGYEGYVWLVSQFK